MVFGKCRADSLEIADLMPHEVSVKLVGHLGVVGLDTAHVVGLFGRQTFHQRTERDLELSTGRGASAQGDTLRISCSIQRGIVSKSPAG